jgi:hypothetical protein
MSKVSMAAITNTEHNQNMMDAACLIHEMDEH